MVVLTVQPSLRTNCDEFLEYLSCREASLPRLFGATTAMTNQFALSLEVVMHANQACYIAIGLAQIRPGQSRGLGKITYHYRRAMKASTQLTV